MTTCSNVFKSCKKPVWAHCSAKEYTFHCVILFISWMQVVFEKRHPLLQSHHWALWILLHCINLHWVITSSYTMYSELVFVCFWSVVRLSIQNSHLLFLILYLIQILEKKRKEMKGWYRLWLKANNSCKEERHTVR